MSLTLNILRSYRRPRDVVRGLATGGVREPQLLFFNALACGLIFVAQWPGLSRAAALDPSITLEQRMGGTLFAVMFILPLLLYGLAGLLQFGLKLARRPVPGLWVRLALFWSLLVVTPLMLMQGGASALVGPSGGAQAFGLLVLVLFVFILVQSVREVVSLTRARTDVSD